MGLFGMGGDVTKLPGQFEKLLKLMEETARNTASLRTMIAGAVTPKDPERLPAPHFEALPFNAATDTQIIGLIITTDTAGWYKLKIGNTDLFTIGLNVYDPQFINLGPRQRIPISVGAQISIDQSAVPAATVNATIVIE